MNAIVPSGKPINYEYSANDNQSSHYIAAKIYDLSHGAGSEILVSTVPMTHLFNGTYWGSYTFSNSDSGKNFLIQKSVYTDNTYTTADPNYPPGSEIVEIDGLDNNTGRSY